MMEHGDPTPRSPAEVLRDRTTYRLVDSKPVGMSIVITVVHRGTEALWQTVYGILHDSYPAQWYRVEPHAITVIDYRRVK